MSEHVFQMGQFEAHFPTDRQYAKNHMWAERRDTIFRFGFTAFAVRLMQDIYFLEWYVENGMDVDRGDPIGAIESKKAESDVCAPADGRLVRFNDVVMDDPSAINTATYDAGWLFEIKTSDQRLLSADEYLRHVDSVWAVTQRIIKGQQ